LVISTSYILSALRATCFHPRSRTTEYSTGILIIEYETPELDKIRKSIEKSKKGGEEESIELREELDDYLNFFEFIASLEKMKQLTLDQVKMVFEYYISRITKHEFLLDYISDQGFENLNTLLSHPQFKSEK
jgi:hypothetical protein